MKQFFALITLSLLVACSGGEKEPEAIEPAAVDMKLPAMADQLIDDGETLQSLLADVQSAESAEAIRPRVEAMIEDYRAMFERMESMNNPSFSDMAALAARAPELAKTQDNIAQEIQRIRRDHPEATEVLREAMKDLGQSNP